MYNFIYNQYQSYRARQFFKVKLSTFEFVFETFQIDNPLYSERREILILSIFISYKLFTAQRHFFFITSSIKHRYLDAYC